MNVAMNMKTSSKRSHQQQPVIERNEESQSEEILQSTTRALLLSLSTFNCRLSTRSTASSANPGRSCPRAARSPSTPSIVGAISLQAPRPACRVVASIVHQNERHRIGRVIRVRSVRHRIDHHLGVAVIGGDDPAAAASLQAVVDAPESGIHASTALIVGSSLPEWPDHVGVGEVHHDDVEIRLAIAFTTVSVTPPRSSPASGRRSRLSATAPSRAPRRRTASRCRR